MMMMNIKTGMSFLRKIFLWI